MSRNDVVMTPLRVKQAIDSRFVKPSENELNVLINGTWVEFVKKVEGPIVVDCAELLTMFKGDTTLTKTPEIDAEKCISLSEVFRGCTNLATVGYIHCPNVTSMDLMFFNCSSLTTIPLLDTSSVLYMSSAFRDCSSLTSVTFQCADVRPYGSDMFRATPISKGNGYIFVPDGLVQAYKTAEGWSTHASVIYGHSDKESMTSQVQQMTAMNIENKPSEEELQLMMLEFDEEELS